MKKLLLLAAVVSLVACSSENVRNDIESNEVSIDFTNVFIEKNTKAVIKNADDLKTPGFGVFASKTDSKGTSQVFGQLSTEANAGTKVSFSNNAWNYTHLRYWDKEATKYDFYAYAPYNTITNNVGVLGNVTWDVTSPTNSFKIEGFKQKTTQSDMIDILTQLGVEVQRAAYNKADPDKVDFTFYHILSNINIQIAISDALETDKTNNPVTVTKVSLGAIKMDGDYKSVSNAYTWVLASQPNTATFNATANNGVVLPSTSLSSTTYANVPGLTDLLFIPQTLPNGNNDKYVIEIEYKIADEVFSRTIALNDFTKTVDQQSVNSTKWESGYLYNYHLIIGPDPIEFDTPDISGWTNTDTYEYTIE